MDVKAEVVLLIFTLNCVTLILLGQDLFRYRLCQDRFADYQACITSKDFPTADPIDIDSTTDTIITTTKAVTRTAAASTTITTKKDTILISITTTATIPTTSSFLITHLIPPLTQSPLPRLAQHNHEKQLPQQQFPHQLLPLSPLNERENTQLTPSPPTPLPGFVDMKFNSGRYGDGTGEDGDEEDDLTKKVKTYGLVIIATFVSTSIASSQVLGRWIDRWSCRTLTLFPLLGMEAWAVCGLLLSSTPSLPLYLWLVGVALCGSSGGFVTLKAAATLYCVQATPRWDSTVRLGLLQAATSLGVLIAYLGWYYIRADDPQSSMTTIFLGIMVLGMLNVFFVFLFSDKPPMTPVTTTTNTTTTPLGDTSDTEIIAYNSSSSLDRYVPREEGKAGEDEEEGGKDENDGEDVDDKDEKENVGKTGKYAKEVLTEAGMESDDGSDGKEKEKGEEAIASCMIGAKKDDDGGSLMHTSFPIVVISPKDENHEAIENTPSITQRSKRKRKLGVIHNFVHLTTCNEEEEKSQEPRIESASPSGDYGSLCYPQSPIPIIISFEDGNSVYGTPPEHSNLPASCCGTPPSRALSANASCTSLETITEAAAVGQQSGLLTLQQQPEARAGAPCYGLRGEHENRPYYERPRHQITGLSSSAPSTFTSLMETESDAALYIPLDKTQTVNKQRVCDSQDDMLMTPNVLLTPASSLSSGLSCEGSNSNSSSSSSVESREVMRGDEGNILYDSASLGDMQGLSPLSVNTANTLTSSCDSTSLRQSRTRSGSMLTIQSEAVGEAGERKGRELLAPWTVAGVSSGEGVCCAGGGDARRCLACVAGRLFCRPVSVTFRRRAAGLRGIVVADMVAAFLVSVVAAGLWEVTPLYLEAKMEWSQADRVSYLACRCSLGVVALVVMLPLLRRRLLLQDTTLGVLGGLSSFLYSVCLSCLSSSTTSAITLALLFGPLTLYLNVASAAILMRLVGVTELGGVLLCLGSVEQAGHVTGWLTFHYLLPLLLRHRMPGVAFLAAGLLLLVPSTIFGVLHFSLGLRNRSLNPHRMPSSTSPSLASHRDPDELQTRMCS